VIGIDREHQENAGAHQTYNRHYQLNHPRQSQAGHAELIEAVGFRMASWGRENGFGLLSHFTLLCHVEFGTGFFPLETDAPKGT
jgi:hypothetical protein